MIYNFGFPGSSMKYQAGFVSFALFLTNKLLIR